jgi:hypothetical protein
VPSPADRPLRRRRAHRAAQPAAVRPGRWRRDRTVAPRRHRHRGPRPAARADADPLAAAALGLVNLYRFDDETFAFEDGRLLLRGNNGTGKSRVLALTVPFLLRRPDGTAPGRARRRPRQAHGVEPAAGQARRPAGLRLDRVRPPSTTRGPPGSSRSAVRHHRLRHARHRRQGRAEAMVLRHRPAHRRRSVADRRDRARAGPRPADRGDRRPRPGVDTATDYRRLLDRELFGLGEHRYEALVDLLVQLRRPSCPASSTSRCSPTRCPRRCRPSRRP